MKGWVKILIAVGCSLAVVAGVIGIIVGINNNNKKADSDAIAQYSSIKYFDENQSAEEPGVLSAWAVGKEQFTKITYQIDTQPEVVIAKADYDKATEAWDDYDNDFEGMNYIDTGVITIDLSELEAGKHIIQVFVYAGSDARECICEKIFTIQ